MCELCKPGFIACDKCIALGSGRLGDAAHHGQFGLGKVGPGEDLGVPDQSNWANVVSELAVWEEGSKLARWHPPIECPRGRPYKETMAAVTPAVALAPHNSISPHMSLAPPKLLTLCQSLGQVPSSENKSVHEPFKEVV